MEGGINESTQALNLLENSVERGKTKTIIEYSSGSTVISMSLIARVFHNLSDVRAYLSNKTAPAKLRLMQFFGLDMYVQAISLSWIALTTRVEPYLAVHRNRSLMTSVVESELLRGKRRRTSRRSTRTNMRTTTCVCPQSMIPMRLLTSRIRTGRLISGGLGHKSSGSYRRSTCYAREWGLRVRTHSCFLNYVVSNGRRRNHDGTGHILQGC